ncbi:DUF2934 domain-containing protein, partial [Methylovulum psychrotolerans]|uniref:DUF2934 domain-containing protein n=1 Tax=Methylovulum psychrotolerans TaxID=1704499 RepID=UPI001B80AA7B
HSLNPSATKHDVPLTTSSLGRLQDIFLYRISYICAYYKSEKRDCIGGDELQDWLAAEAEISKQVSYWFQEC